MVGKVSCLRAHGTALHTLLRNLLPPTSPSGLGSNLFLLSIPPPCCITDAIAHFRTRRMLLAAMSRLCALMSDKSHVVARILPPLSPVVLPSFIRSGHLYHFLLPNIICTSESALDSVASISTVKLVLRRWHTCSLRRSRCSLLQLAPHHNSASLTL